VLGIEVGEGEQLVPALGEQRRGLGKALGELDLPVPTPGRSARSSFIASSDCSGVMWFLMGEARALHAPKQVRQELDLLYSGVAFVRACRYWPGPRQTFYV